MKPEDSHVGALQFIATHLDSSWPERCQKHVQVARKALQSATEEGWLPMESAPKDKPILAYCHHESDPYWEDEGKRLTVYETHAEGMSHVQDGPHVLVWGGGYTEGDHESGYSVAVPDWWFLSGSDFEVAANPIGWRPVPKDFQVAEKNNVD